MGTIPKPPKERQASNREPPEQSRSPFFVTREAADVLRLKESTLQNWRSKGIGPPFLRFGSRIVYDREALLAWARERSRTSTTETDGGAS